MVVIKEVVNKRGLNFANQRKVVILRDKNKKKPMAFKTIASKVRNLLKKPSCEDVVRRVYHNFSETKGRVTYNYGKCGRKPWVLTPRVKKFVLKRLLQQRRRFICTSSTLQADVYKELGVTVHTSAIRRFLRAQGFHWLPRAQKRKYHKDARRMRRAWAGRLRRMSLRKLREHITFAMDGVVLTVPPQDATQRHNFCFHGETHMYRKTSEAAHPDLAGDDPYSHQVPLARAVPLWGAISPSGFCELAYHRKKKLDTDEWMKVLASGKMRVAIAKLQPSKPRGPWRILCDNETFIKAKPVKKWYLKKNISLLQIPPRSPDLNPIESFWGWLRQRLRRMDLSDLRAGRPALGKVAYKRRVRAVLRSRKAQDVAQAKFNALKKVCAEVCRKQGAAARS